MLNNDIAELVIRLKADASRLEAEMRKANGIVEQSSGKMRSAMGSVASAAKALIPALSVGALVAFTKGAINAGDALNDMSARTGVSVEALSSLQLGATLADVSMQQLGQALQFMNRNLENSPEAFERLGINLQAFRNLRTEQQFVEVADRISQLGSVSERTAALVSIFGRSGVELAVLMKDGAAGIQQAIDKAKELGLVLSSEEAARMAKFNDTWDTMTAKLRRLAQDGFLFAANAVRVFKNQLTGGDLRVPIDELTSVSQLTIRKRTAETELRREQQRLIEQDDPSKFAQHRREIERLNEEIAIAGRRIVGFIPSNDNISSTNTGNTPVTKQIEAAVKASQATEDLNNHVKLWQEQMESAKRETEAFTESLKNNLSQGLTQAVFSANSAGDAFRNMAMQIAQAIFERSIAQPFSSGIVNGIDRAIGGGGLAGIFGSLLPSFDVGSYNLPRDMIAQVHKGEMIIPAAQAEQIRNGGIGGVTVIQNNSFGAGVSRAEVQAVLPQVARAAHDAVFASMQRGGSASKIVGLK